MAKRNGRRKLKNPLKGKSISNIVYPVVKSVTAPIAFLEQISKKDRDDLGQTFTTAGYSTQLKMMSNIVLGRIAGFTPFHKLSDGTMLPTAPQTINVAGVNNKWTQGALMGLAYQFIGSHINKMTGKGIIPQTSKIGTISKSALIGGALGGFFDDAPAKAQTFTRQIPMQNRVLTNTTYNSGQDSTGSSF
tara:strand:- start:355 stop:924 length:570 start_codon:yes stop_codon:yes gene_type:complete